MSVNGEGTFNCVMTIRIDKDDFHFLTDKQGIIITETDDEQPGWTYDETSWFLQPHYEWNEDLHEYEWTGGWDCYNKFEVTEGGVLFDRDDAQGGLGFVNTYTENTYKTATLNKTDHFAFLKGYPGGGFAPGKNMSRAEVTTMFARLLTEQMEANKSYPASFSDVTSAHWAANYIGYMEQFGIVRGYSDGTFRPNAPITRAEFAAICCRFEQLTERNCDLHGCSCLSLGGKVHRLCGDPRLGHRLCGWNLQAGQQHYQSRGRRSHLPPARTQRRQRVYPRPSERAAESLC